MESIFPDYTVNQATWFYLSSLLIIAVFFRFSRIWSLRNLDLGLVLALSPGLVLVEKQPPLGYVWLFAVTGLLLVRLFCDGLFQRRPRLEQNLNPPGLAFLGASAAAFLAVMIFTKPLPHGTIETVRRADHLLQMRDAESSRAEAADAETTGPATSLLAAPVLPLSSAVASGNAAQPQTEQSIETVAARFMALLAHLAVVGGLFMLAQRHFGDPSSGLAMAALYLLIPCTAYDVAKVNHVLPAALILWALVAYRRPMAAGGLMGLACGTLFFPVFLLPLWASFYDRRGALRFGLALGIVGTVLLGCLAFTSADSHSFTRQVIGSIDWRLLEFRGGEGAGFWSMYDAAYRIPVFAAFVVMLVFLTLWPRRKTLEELIAHSAAIVVATQFWYPHQGGIYLLWYLPLLLVVVFRPRLAHLLPPDLTARTAEPRRTAEPPRRELAAAGASGRQLFR